MLYTMFSKDSAFLITFNNPSLYSQNAEFYYQMFRSLKKQLNKDQAARKRYRSSIGLDSNHSDLDQQLFTGEALAQSVFMYVFSSNSRKKYLDHIYKAFLPVSKKRIDKVFDEHISLLQLAGDHGLVDPIKNIDTVNFFKEFKPSILNNYPIVPDFLRVKK